MTRLPAEYLTSDWSGTFTYTIPDQEKLTLAEVNVFVNGFKSRYKLKSITSMYIDGVDLYTQGILTVDGEIKAVTMEILDIARM